MSGLAGLGAIVVGLAAGPARANVLAAFTTHDGFESQAAGQSVTTAAGGPFDHIRFNFYSATGNDFSGPLGPAAAPGTLYIFDSVYTGTLAGLATSSYLAKGFGNGAVYLFNDAFTLLGGTQYFFYEDDKRANLQININRFQGYAGGNAYGTFLSSGSDPSFVSSVDGDYNFTLTGTTVTVATPVPEPLGAALFGIGMLGLGAVRRGRLRVSA
jgi:hypothetical protein